MSTIPRPALLRSLTFWGGLLAVIFTLWAWKDSVRNWTAVGSGYTSISSQSCGLMVHHRLVKKSTWWPSLWRQKAIITPLFGKFGELDALRFGRPDFGGYLEPEIREELNRTGLLEGRRPDAIIGYFYAEREVVDPDEWLLFIPYWCVLLAVMAAWLGLIYWRSRRIRRGDRK